MSRSRKLRLGIGILLAAILAALFVIRVIYINTVKYQITERVVYQPHLFSYFNGNASASMTLDANEVKTVTMIFPCILKM